ncbi:hypothetical protein [Aquabacterium sp.]|jgi:hypothetical protein|uniref:hypothetical protein n=1 Tax=Aquabacterium sp. TaxID=1872578 RepID=UPI0025C13D60|nr:hypothetical protein [Aquabacterium sp.]
MRCPSRRFSLLVVAGLCVALQAGLVKAQSRSPASLEAAVRAYARSQGAGDVSGFRHALFDLNRDGQDDALVLLTGPDWCGSGGCTLLVWRGVGGRFQRVSVSSVTGEPLRVLASERRHGWATLIVHARGHGEALMRFNGRRYPGNPSLAPLASEAQLGQAQVVMP